MQKIEDGNVSIEIEGKEANILVSLEATQYRLETISQYELFLEPSPVLLPGKIIAATDERMEIEYTRPTYGASISAAVKDVDLLGRVEIARKLSALKQDEGDVALFFLHPENLFLISNQLYVGHRGLIGSIEPKVSTFDQFLKQYKALVISTLNSKYKYEDMIAGRITVKDKALAAILSATAICEIEALLDEQYYALSTARKITERSVKKSSYGTFKFLAVVLAVVVVGMGIWLGLLLENTVPRQGRIIEAQAAYMVNNFGEAVSTLSEDDPRTLPPSAQYMLASSYVQLSTLSLAERQVVLNNLSPSSHENELRYWIYLGRGQLGNALDIAYSLGSNLLKINAYGYLYEYVYADMNMPGEEKQNRLSQYRRRMEELASELQEQVPDQIMPVAPEEEEEAEDGSE